MNRTDIAMRSQLVQWAHGANGAADFKDVAPLVIVADESIAGLDHYFMQGLCEARAQALASGGALSHEEARQLTASTVRIVRHPGLQISATDLADAHVLIVRSITRVTAELLRHASLEFVGSCTIGTDHLDLNAIAERQIQWAHAPGCNANAVAEYVLEQVMAFCAQQSRAIEGLRVGIVGYGNVGRRVVDKLALFGCEVVISDPPVEQQQALDVEPTVLMDSNAEASPNALAHELRHESLAVPTHGVFGSLEDVFACDVVSVHVPLMREGEWPTYHMVSLQRLLSMPEESLFINTARGAVVDLIPCMRWRVSMEGRQASGRRWVFDVFEDEPGVNPSHLPLLDGVTPHIAGHSQLGKESGVRSVWQALLKQMGLPVPRAYPFSMPLPESQLSVTQTSLSATDWVELLTRVSGLTETDRQFRAVFSDAAPNNLAERFESLRRVYRPRKELSQVYVVAPQLAAADVACLRALGVRVGPQRSLSGQNDALAMSADVRESKFLPETKDLNRSSPVTIGWLRASGLWWWSHWQKIYAHCRGRFAHFSITKSELKTRDQVSDVDR